MLLDHAFAAMADPTRRAILEELRSGERTVSQLARPHRVSLQAIHKHLQVLQAARLIDTTKRGRSRHCRLRAQTMKQAVDYMMEYRDFWERRLDNLADLLENDPNNPGRRRQDDTERSK